MPLCIKLFSQTHVYCRLKRKIACKTGDEHALVKGMPPPNETIAKIAAKNISGKPGKTHERFSVTLAD